MSVWGAPAEISQRQVDLSDVTSFHFYGPAQGLHAQIARYKPLGRPVINTEWMARLQGSRWETDLPIFRAEGVGCYSWGLVNGRTQCQFAWYHPRGTPEPEVWFHDLFHADGRPYAPAEPAAIRRITTAPPLDWDSADYRALLTPLPPADPARQEDGFDLSAGWTRWNGPGPRRDRLHYCNTPGGTATVRFEGVGIDLVHKAGPDCGLASVLIDGKPPQPVPGSGLNREPEGAVLLDTYSPQVEWNRVTRLAADLPPGPHRLTLRVTGRHHPQSTGAYIQVVQAEPIPPP